MWFLCAIGLLAIATAPTAAAAGAQSAIPKVSANDLVREAVQKELNSAGSVDKLMYRMRKQTPERIETKEYVETDMGTIARLVAINDQPLPAHVQAKEDARLEQLAANPDLQKDRLRKQKEDEQRANRMVAGLPDAFIYRYDGTEPWKYGEMVRLTFEPNPNYDPPTRELKVYQGMRGTMWIDSGSHHMLRLEAALFRDVDFGWGILGRLYKGGKFEIEQQHVTEGRWEITAMNLDFTGKALIFKSLVIKDRETLSNFRRAPDNLTVAQAVELLRKVELTGAVAQDHGGHSGAVAAKR
jgi:hypothetical protein